MRIQWRITVFLCFTVAVLACAFCLPRIPQDPAYHLFVDGRSIFGIQNFFNVLSNIPFLVAGIWGLGYTVSRRQTAKFQMQSERWPYIALFLGLVLTCFGSAYYHWSPDNSTLFWDRLPMAVVFMGIFASVLGDRISAKVGRLWLWPMLAIGIFSVIYWRFSELNGIGDLRPYVVVQFYTLAAVCLLISLFPSRYTHSGWLIVGGAAYIAAKILEALDQEIFSVVGISGHTLKHLVAAAAGFCILAMLKQRKMTEARMQKKNANMDVKILS
jgi:hypothetical protein